ncbi:MAG TPA: response regulator, partial [Luteitalea sp.]|nr:response regulator [Luteitalea sp.]
MAVNDGGVILNINDDEATRYVLSRTLRRAGYEIWEASSGYEGLMLARQSPRLIVLDIKLPDIDGLEVCRRLKADSRTSHIPVLQTSATFVSADRKAEGLESGADGYLAQPVEPTELIATVRALLRAQDAEASLREAGMEWQWTFDAIAEAAAIINDQGLILRSNRAFLSLVKCTVGDISGRPVREVFRDCLGVDNEVLDVR